MAGEASTLGLGSKLGLGAGGAGLGGLAALGAAGVLSPVAVAALGGLASTLGPAFAQATPGPMEEAYRKDIEADRAALAAAGGHGLTSSQRGTYLAEGLGAQQAREQQMLANLARGSATGDVGGQQQPAIRDVYQAGQAGQNQLGSSIRQADVNEYARKKAELGARMAQAITWGRESKDKTLTQLKDVGAGSLGQGIGAGQRAAVAGEMSQGASAIGGGVPSSSYTTPPIGIGM